MPSKVSNNVFIAVGAVTVAAIAAVFLINHAALFAVSRLNNLDISFKEFRGFCLGRLEFKDLNVSDKRTGFGIYSERAQIIPRLAKSAITLRFSMSGVRFRKGAANKGPAYDTLSDLVAAPFSGGWNYRSIDGVLGLSKGAITLDDFMASGDDIRFSLNGALEQRSVISADVIIYFSERITAKIPPELSDFLLHDEGSGWKSFSVHLAGDYTAPAISVTGKMFKLNVSSVSAPE